MRLKRFWGADKANVRRRRRVLLRVSLRLSLWMCVCRRGGDPAQGGDVRRAAPRDEGGGHAAGAEGDGDDEGGEEPDVGASESESASKGRSFKLLRFFAKRWRK